MDIPPILTGRSRVLFAGLVANAAGQAGMLFLHAMLIRYAFDHFLQPTGFNPQGLTMVGAGWAACALASGWLKYNERVIAEKMGQRYVHRLRMKLFRHLSRMDRWQVQRKRPGAVMLRFVGDLNALRRWVSYGIVHVVVSGAIIAATLILLAMIDGLLCVVTALMIAAGLMINMRIAQTLRSTAREARLRRSRLSANVNEKIARMGVVQAFGQRRREINKLRRQSRRLGTTLVTKASLVGLIRGVTQSGTTLAVAAVLVIGIFSVHAGRTTPGTVAAAMIVLGFMMPALKNSSRIHAYYQDAMISRTKLSTILRRRSRIRLGSALPDLPAGGGGIKLDGVSVDGILENVSAEAAAGDVVAIVGPNGAGKSVLIDLIARLISPDQGRILIDGLDTSRHNLESVRRAVGMVSPDLPLLAGTVNRNLRYRHPKCSPEELAAVRDLCGIDALLDDLPQGQQTRIQEGGRNLSAGQRQRLLLARALLGGPAILLLDEVDAHMDENARSVLRDVMRQFKGTVLWVTHQDVPLVGVDAIWRMENGTLSAIIPDRGRRRAVSLPAAATPSGGSS